MALGRDGGSRDQIIKIGLAFAVCSLTLTAGFFTRRPGTRLTLEMSSEVASTAQLFYDLGPGYRESESRTQEVRAGAADQFTKLVFDLPDGFRRLRFDPLTTAGRFAIRKVELRSPGGVLWIEKQAIQPLHQIESRREQGDTVVFSTTPGAEDPSLSLGGELEPALKRLKWRRALRLSMMAIAALAAGMSVCLWLYYRSRAGGIVRRAVLNMHARVGGMARRMSVPGFIRFDAPAMWIYFVCMCAFLLGGLANLNGSSAGVFSSVYGHGTPEGAWLGAPRPIRSDEWAYVTPNILNQSLRTARFEARKTDLGDHFVGLSGNIPVRHISTLFRPQFWPFFLLRVDYAFAFNWQFKALILFTGVFTWLLQITRSTTWAAAGAIWFYFSPFTQWSYSWPSALPEMIGSLCFAMVLACFLLVGRNGVALALGAAGLALCSINFAMCAYLPHLVPLFWLGAFFVTGWCYAHWRQILVRRGAGKRLAALMGAAVAIGGVGALVYSDLHIAITALANTVYPGKRVYAGGMYSPYELASHFLAWGERENRFPPLLGNICEGSGFLWLAPATLLCIGRMRARRTQRIYLLALWTAACFLLAWLLLPLPASWGSLFQLQETVGSRMLPVLGLLNVAIVSVCVAALRRRTHRQGSRRWWRLAAGVIVASAAMLLLLRSTNARLGFFFGRTEVLGAALMAGLLIALLAGGRKTAFGLLLVLPQVILFSAVNPVVGGMPVFLSSDLFAFVRNHPAVRQGKWMVFSSSVVSSGFVAASGCDVYTGTRYLPDVDHFGLFAAHHYDIGRLNRGGYLTAHLRRPEELQRIELPDPSVIQWDVRPGDAIVRELGINYVAFDQPLAPAGTFDMIPLAAHAVDGFWLYRLP